MDLQFLSSVFKGVDVIQEGPDMIVSQMVYIHTKGKSAHASKYNTKLNLNCSLADEETPDQRIATGRLARIGKGTSPSFAFLASMALQRSADAVDLMHSFHDAYERLVKTSWLIYAMFHSTLKQYTFGFFQTASSRTAPARTHKLAISFCLQMLKIAITSFIAIAVALHADQPPLKNRAPCT